MGKEKEIEEKIKKIIEQFNEEYNILCILEEEELREKIIEFKFDEEKIREWIEEKLSQ